MTSVDVSIVAARDDAVARSAVSSLSYAHVLAVAFLALLPRAILLDHIPHMDEMYHVMAAGALLENGTLGISGGEPYTRAWLFTYATAGMFALFGESLVVARILPLLAGVALVVVLFLWLSRVAGRTAGWCCAVLMSLDPHAIEHSQLVRFYSIQPLLFWVGTIAVYTVVSEEHSMRRRAALLAGAAVAYLVALHLQSVTMVGLAAVGGWATLAMVPLAWRRIAGNPSRFWIAGGLAVLGMALVVAVLTSAAFSDAMRMANAVPQWAAAQEGNIRYYYWSLQNTQPIIFALFPLLAVIAFGSRQRPVTLCLAIFAFAFVFHSFFAGWKAARYISAAMPAFFAVAAIGIAVLAGPVIAYARTAVANIVGSRVHARGIRLSAAALLIVGVAIGLLASPGFARLRNALGAAATEPYIQNGDWELAAELLSPRLDSADVVLASVKTTGLYYLGRVDVVLRGPEYPDRQPADGWDTQIDRPYVSTVPALESIYERHDYGLVVSDSARWRKDFAVTPAVTAFIEANMERVPLPRSSHMIAYRWSR